MSRALRLAYCVVLIFSVVCAFVVLKQVDEYGPLSGDSMIQISGDLPISSSKTIALLDEVTAAHHASIVRMVIDVDNPGRDRHFYVLAADPASAPASWVKEGYPSFTQSLTTHVHPLADLSAADPRGDYVFFGPHTACDDVVSRLRAAGFTVDAAQYFDPLRTTWWFLTQPIGTSFVVVTLLAMLLVVGSVLVGVKRYGVERLHGFSVNTMVWRDARRVVQLQLGVGMGVALVTGVALWSYNRGRQWQTMAALSVAMAMIMTGALLLTQYLSVIIVRGLDLLDTLAGRLRSRWALVGLYAIRVSATLLAVAAISTSSLQWSQVRQYERGVADWASDTRTVGINFNPRLSVEEQDSYAILAGKWIVSEEQAGRAILSQKITLQLKVGNTHQGLLVNNNYLNRHPVLGSDGTRIPIPSTNGILVIIPTSLMTQEPEILGAVQSTFAQASLPLSVKAAPEGQQVFCYGVPANNDLDAELTDAVIVVVNSESGAIRADDYMAYASQGGVLMTDVATAAASAREHGVDPFILAFRPAAQAAADRYEQLLREWRMTIANLIVALAVLVVTALSVSAIYISKNYQRTFARYISGWPLLRTHGPVLAVELALVGLTLASAVTLSTPDPARQSTGDPPWASGAIIALAVVNGTLFLVSLSLLTRRLVRTRSAEA